MRDETAAPHPDLKPANENPWYVLMTLYGEQEGEKNDQESLTLSRRAWNAWASFHVEEPQRAYLAKSGISVGSSGRWHREKADIQKKLASEYNRRNPGKELDPSFLSTSARIDLKKLFFERHIDLSEFIFPMELDLSGSEFSQTSSFESAGFASACYASNTVFNGLANFSHAVAYDVADFTSAEFFEEAIFDGFHFGQKADFSSVQFRKSAFICRSTFRQGARFIGADFHVDLDIHGIEVAHSFEFSSVNVVGKFDGSHSTFSGVVDFSLATFLSRLDLERVTFGEDANFFEAEIACNASFAYASFKGFANFADATFGKRDRVLTGETLFTGCTFSSPVNFGNTCFVGEFPTFSGTVLHEKTSFTAKVENWPTTNQLVPVHAKESCATIRHILANQGLPEDEHFFFRREMFFAGRIGSLWQRLPYLLFGLFSDYGHSIARPALWLPGFGPWGWQLSGGILRIAVSRPTAVTSRGPSGRPSGSVSPTSSRCSASGGPSTRTRSISSRPHCNSSPASKRSSACRCFSSSASGCGSGSGCAEQYSPLNHRGGAVSWGAKGKGDGHASDYPGF